jgi:endonuclease YncB( thermonuclease family)
MYEYRVVQIINVHDGDTLDVVLDLGLDTWRHIKRMRLAGLDAPELRTKKGVAARDYLVQLLQTEGELICRTEKRKEFEKFGGVLGRLYIRKPDASEVDICQELLNSTHAVPYDGKRKQLDPTTGELPG